MTAQILETIDRMRYSRRKDPRHVEFLNIIGKLQHRAMHVGVADEAQFHQDVENALLGTDIEIAADSVENAAKGLGHLRNLTKVLIWSFRNGINDEQDRRKMLMELHNQLAATYMGSRWLNEVELVTGEIDGSGISPWLGAKDGSVGIRQSKLTVKACTQMLDDVHLAARLFTNDMDGVCDLYLERPDDVSKEYIYQIMAAAEKVTPLADRLPRSRYNLPIGASPIRAGCPYFPLFGKMLRIKFYPSDERPLKAMTRAQILEAGKQILYILNYANRLANLDNGRQRGIGHFDGELSPELADKFYGINSPFTNAIAATMDAYFYRHLQDHSPSAIEEDIRHLLYRTVYALDLWVRRSIKPDGV